MEESWSKEFSQDEWDRIKKFSSFVNKIASLENGIHSPAYAMASFSDLAGIDLYSYPKEGVMMHALWVIFFSHLKSQIPRAVLKYPTVTSFLTTYHAKFDEYNSDDQNVLCDIANWMNEMFKYLPARKNKGLAIQMIPKLVEGWHAKYVTGSGQTKATSDRVFIFQTEGGVQPAHRGGRVSAPKKLPSNKSKRSAIKFGDDSSEYKKRKTKRSFRTSSKDWQSIEREMITDDGDYCPDDTYTGKDDIDCNSLQNVKNADVCIVNVNSFNANVISFNANVHASCEVVDSRIPDPVVSEMSEYVNVFNIASGLPTQTMHPVQVPVTQGPGSQGPLGPANFQPLFDFTLLGGLSQSPRETLPISNGYHCEPLGKASSSQLVSRPPILKRAYSWESDYIENGNDRKKFEFEINNGETSSGDNSNCGIKKEVSMHKGHPKPTFLFDAYLQSHP